MSLRYRVIRQPQQYVYADIQLIFSSENNDGNEMTEREFKLIVMTALKDLHGDIGVAVLIDILKYQPETRRAYIRTNSKDYVLMRNSLTLFSKWKDESCYFTVHKVCHSLSSLAIDSCQHFVVKTYS